MNRFESRVTCTDNWSLENDGKGRNFPATGRSQKPSPLFTAMNQKMLLFSWIPYVFVLLEKFYFWWLLSCYKTVQVISSCILSKPEVGLFEMERNCS